MEAGYSLAALLRTQQALRACLLDTTGGVPRLRLYDDSTPPVTLADFFLDVQASRVDEQTAELVLVVAVQEDAALTAGVASHLEVCDGAGLAHLRLPCQQGIEPVAGVCVLNALEVQAEAPVELRACMIPAGPRMG